MSSKVGCGWTELDDTKMRPAFPPVRGIHTYIKMGSFLSLSGRGGGHRDVIIERSRNVLRHVVTFQCDKNAPDVVVFITELKVN